MVHSRNGSSSFQRRPSTRQSLALSHTDNFDGDDDYDLSAMMVADGFRPSDNAPSSNAPLSNSHAQPQFQSQFQTQQHQIPTSSPIVPQNPSDAIESISKDAPNMRVRPSSVSKPPQIPHDSLALRNDGSSAAAGQTGLSRMSSISSDSPVLRLESPYRGPSGPSHPYQMYPQRTLSVATTSTTAGPRSERSYTGPRGPAHPYGLYTQTTASDGDNTQPPIPLGFTGMRDNYQRQLGPDGEEAGDLIGPLGHMEELPPYSRYPENAFVPKITTQPISEEPSSPDRTIAGAGGIGIATRNPEFSTDDLGLSRSRPSVRSARSDNSHYDVNGAALDVAEKPLPNKWQRRAKKKLWGIVPYWAICLLIVALILMGIIMGATIGTLLSRHKPPPPPGPDDKKHTKPTPTLAADIEPLQTVPPNLLPIETGLYGLPPLNVMSGPNLCFKDTTQSQAWSCSVPYVYYMMNIDCIPDQSPISKYLLTLVPYNDSDPKLIYGTQPPNIPDPVTLTLVNDTYEPGRGPAWYLEKTYNKTVIISEESFTSVSKRGWDSYDDSGRQFAHSRMKKKYGAETGDKPWICTWPETTLEVFIYPNQNASSRYAGATSTNSYSPTSTVSYADPAETYNPPFKPPPTYPKVIKMLERRLSNSDDTVAFCRQVEVVPGGGTKDVCDKDGNPIEIVLQLNIGDGDDYNKRFRYSRSVKQWGARSLIETNACGCLWYSN